MPFDLDVRLAEMRNAFDRSFAAPPAAVAGETLDLLAIRVAGSPYALRVREIAGLTASKKIVPLPTQRGELLGLAGMRGSLVLVYGLAILLGHTHDHAPVRWLAISGSAEPIALGFAELEGFLRVPLSDVHRSNESDRAKKPISAIARVGDLVRPIVDIPLTVAALKIRTGTAGFAEER